MSAIERSIRGDVQLLNECFLSLICSIDESDHPQVGFSGGLVVDFPHSTRAKKYFLVLMVGTSTVVPQAKGLDGSEPEDEEDAAQVKVRCAATSWGVCSLQCSCKGVDDMRRPCEWRHQPVHAQTTA